MQRILKHYKNYNETHSPRVSCVLLFREFVSKFHANVCDEICQRVRSLGSWHRTSAAAGGWQPPWTAEPKGKVATRNQPKKKKKGKGKKYPLNPMAGPGIATFNQRPAQLFKGPEQDQPAGFPWHLAAFCSGIKIHWNTKWKFLYCGPCVSFLAANEWGNGQVNEWMNECMNSKAILMLTLSNVGIGPIRRAPGSDFGHNLRWVVVWFGIFISFSNITCGLAFPHWDCNKNLPSLCL